MTTDGLAPGQAGEILSRLDQGKITKAATFAGPFITAMLKLRQANDEGTGVTLTVEEAKAALDGLKMLAKGS